MKTKQQYIARDKARAQTVKVNGIIKVMKQNKAAGLKYSFEYMRWVVGQKQYRDALWVESGDN